MKYVKENYQIPGLPAAYDETGAESETLKVYLEDAPGGKVRVTLLYGVFAELDIITRAVQITNQELGGGSCRKRRQVLH